MHKMMIALSTATLALTGAAAQAGTKGEDELAEMLEGRTAGEPQSCINTMRSSGDMTIINKTAIVYRDGKTIWVNYTAHPETLRRSDMLVIEKTSSSQLCKLDSVKTMDRTGHFMTGVVFLEDFIPYTKTDDEEG